MLFRSLRRPYALLLLLVVALAAAGAAVTWAELPGRAIPTPTPTPTPSATASTTPQATPTSTATFTAQPTQTPTPAARSLRVGIQIGHYKIKEVPPELAPIGKQWGTYGGGRNEVDVNLDVAEAMKEIMTARGIEVDLISSIVPSGYTADAFVSLHADGAGNTERRGFKASTRYSSMVAPQDALLTELLVQQYADATGIPQDYRINANMRDYYAFAPGRPNYRISNYTPAVLIEMGHMTNAVDRNILFNEVDMIAGVISGAVMDFLSTAYPNPTTQMPYGFGVEDPTIDVSAPSFPTPPAETTEDTETGDWQMYLMGKDTVKLYRYHDGGGGVVAELPTGQFQHSTLRKGDFYRVQLPDGTEGWLHRNLMVIQMR